MHHNPTQLARRLSRMAEDVCRHYLPGGQRQGNYWLVGDVTGRRGQSLFVRLTGPDHGKGAAGKWIDAATGEHGDLLDLIAANRGLHHWSLLAAEVGRFLNQPFPVAAERTSPVRPVDLSAAARRIWDDSRPIAGTLVEDWLRHRGIHHPVDPESLRFHPRCRHREQNRRGRDPVWTSWPAMIAAVRDHDGRLTGIHRTWLDPAGQRKAPLAKPRRAMGSLLGQGVRLGTGARIMAAGEGIETMLSLREILPHLPAIAALSANHLAALVLPSSLRRLYLVRDDDPAGHWATAALAQRARERGIEARILDPGMPHRSHGDLNDALRQYGLERLRDIVGSQLVAEDAHGGLVSPLHGRDTERREHSGRLSSG